ncbi:MAG: tyrosine--tRNA ligase [bacterium]|nr:tyrosine--tRNA ligase [bacterium]
MDQLEKIRRGVAEIISEDELRDKLNSKRPLRIKFGADPTSPDIHLGHTVILRKLRQFQELGHRVIFIIGDFTARIGDPSGRQETRPSLSEREIFKNAETYKEQVFKILDRSKTEVVFNSSWLDRMDLRDVVKLSSLYTVARMLERDDFKKRYDEKRDITILEFLYPLLQGYDSVILHADVEIGGTDQRFNLLVGRVLQRRFGQESQVVITMPLLEGLDGVRKMSKSYGNYVGVTDSAKEMFGKLMSIPDSLMDKYFELLTEVDLNKIRDLHPKKKKMCLAKNIVSFYYGRDAAEEEEKEFERIFRRKEYPKEIPIFYVKKREINLVELMKEGKLVESKLEAKRLISQGGVRIDGKRILAEDYAIKIENPCILQVGKRRFLKIAIQNGKDE